MHQSGPTVESCGSLALNTGSDYIMEAFLFAISTAQTRYPYLLPNVSIGALGIDSCSDTARSLKTLLNFETCVSSLSEELLPDMVASYISYGSSALTSALADTAKRVKKVASQFGSNPNGDILSQIYSSYSIRGLLAVVYTLEGLDWTYVDVLCSSGSEQDTKVSEFLTAANHFNICIAQSVDLDDTDMSVAYDILIKSAANVVVVLADGSSIKRFIAYIVSRPLVSKTFVFGELPTLWEDNVDINLPLGSIVVDLDAKLNTDLMEHLPNTLALGRSSLNNPWLQQFAEARVGCGTNCRPPGDIYYLSSQTVLLVDFMLHALHERYMMMCPERTGFCPSFSSAGIALTDDLMKNASFIYQNKTTIKHLLSAEDSGASYTVKNFQTNNRLVEVCTNT